MELNECLSLAMFPVLLLLLMSGFPVAFVLAGTAIIFGFMGHILDLFFWDDFGFIPMRIYGIVTNFTLLAVPLFVFMGVLLDKSGIAEELLDSLGKVFRKRKSSMACAVMGVGALLAASTGIVGATVITMGVLSLPTMLDRGYDKSLATGVIASSGTLGQIIPPSIVLVLLGDMMNVDVGDLFTGAMIPGLILLSSYLLYIIILSSTAEEKFGRSFETAEKISLFTFAKSFLTPLFLMVVVLGSILIGIASPTEAASCGAVGTILTSLLRRRLNIKILMTVAKETALTTTMVFMILMGAQFFGVVFRGLGGDEAIQTLVLGFESKPYLILFFLMCLLFILGFFLDFLEICFIFIPIILPITTALGFNNLWLGILIAVNLQTSFLTPPFGFALFYLKGVAPEEVSTLDIYKGVVPFVIIQLLVLGLLATFPALVLWLPSYIFAN